MPKVGTASSAATEAATAPATMQQEAPPTEPKDRSVLHIGGGIFVPADFQMESDQPEPRRGSLAQIKAMRRRRTIVGHRRDGNIREEF
jgi:hypothetical protein